MSHTISPPVAEKIGELALRYCKLRLPLGVYQSNAGFYIGTYHEGPCSRESAEYFRNRAKAEAALANGEWTQRDEP